MLLRTKGTPYKVSESAIVGKVTRDFNSLDESSIFICENEETQLDRKSVV